MTVTNNLTDEHETTLGELGYAVQPIKFQTLSDEYPGLKPEHVSRKNGRGWSLRPEIHQVRASVQACTEIHYIAHSLLQLHQNSLFDSA